MATTIAAIAGGPKNATATIADESGVVSVCAQERVTRVRAAGVNDTGLPDEALDLLLSRSGRTRADVDRWITVDSDPARAVVGGEAIDRHRALAATAYFTSNSSDAAILVCDATAPEVSVWRGRGTEITRVEWPWQGPGFSTLFARGSAALGFTDREKDQQAEALARLVPPHRDAGIDALITRQGEGLAVSPTFDSVLRAGLRQGGGSDLLDRARAASALHARLGDLLVGLLADVRAALGSGDLCLGGSLFRRSSINTTIRRSAGFSRVFVPVDPGDGGLAVGAATLALDVAPSNLSPFLGPTYSFEETKQVLDSCKLQYDWAAEGDAINIAVEALREGRMVGWFSGAMEWGPRALGARSILANPLSPYVLDNLNRFLKHRDPWRGYALSGAEEAMDEFFDGAGPARRMECDFRPRDPQLFRSALPFPQASVRVQTVPEDSELPAFRGLIDAFGRATGVPFVVNTSFNGFHEPIVCNPRDAVRVFYGTGLDMLVINQFVLRK